MKQLIFIASTVIALTSYAQTKVNYTSNETILEKSKIYK